MVLIIGIVIPISYLVFFLTGLAYGLAKDNILLLIYGRQIKIVLKEASNKNISSSMMEKKVIDDFRTSRYHQLTYPDLLPILMRSKRKKDCRYSIDGTKPRYKGLSRSNRRRKAS